MYNDHKVKSLHIILPKTSAYVKSYDGQTNWVYFLIKDDDLLEKYYTNWDNVSAEIKKEFNSEAIYNKEILKTKKKFIVYKSFKIFFNCSFMMEGLIM